MTRKNRYASRARISSKQLRQLLGYLALDLTASQKALLTGLNRNTVNRYVGAMRARIAQFCEGQSPFGGGVEVDEFYFGARRIKGKRGRGAYGKTIVFGIFQRNGQVYTESQYRGWLNEAGFTDIVRTPFLAGNSLISAHKI